MGRPAAVEAPGAHHRTEGGPRVSIVIPAYNSGRHLADTLRSVQAQTLMSWELVVYDDGSTDETVALTEQFAAADPRIRVVRGSNGGVAAAGKSLEG